MTSWLSLTANPAPSASFLFGMAATEFLFHCAVISGALILLWLGVNWIDRLRLQWYRNSRTPESLFRELCRAHELTYADRRTLESIAQAAPSEQCCRVFVDPRVIGEFARAHPGEADECRRLERHLFGDRAL